jgi:hypothetical protein
MSGLQSARNATCLVFGRARDVLSAMLSAFADADQWGAMGSSRLSLGDSLSAPLTLVNRLTDIKG